MLGRQQWRRDTAANWSSNNPTLAAGEVGLDTTNNLVKVGDGATGWNSLGYFHVQPRIGTTTSSTTPSIDCSLYDQYNITALAANITSVTVSNAFDGCKLLVRITGTATRTITWGSSFQSSGVATLLATTSGTKTHMIGFIFDATISKFVCHAVDTTGY